MPTIEQIRAARALLDWSQSDLADHAGLSQTGIARIENGTNKPNTQTVEKIMAAFDRSDIEFIGSSGLRKKADHIRTLRGKEGFRDFIYDVYETIRKDNEEDSICVSNVNERMFDKWQDTHRDDYLYKMHKLYDEKKFAFKILVQDGDEHHVARYAQYKSLKVENFGTVPFYIYGTKTAMLLFEENDVAVYIINNREIADAQRKQFNIIWSSARS